MIITTMLFFSACSYEPLATVQHVDIQRYMGKWYEIASFPQRFQKGCTCTVAEYTLNDNGTVKVDNSCTAYGKGKQSIGIAKVTDKETNAKLKVSFFRPFWGKYWIIDLADDYSYAVVGHPNRKYLWILCRTPQMDKAVYESILERVQAKGFDTTMLSVTEQKGCR